jgi:hypothetical protein
MRYGTYGAIERVLWFEGELWARTRSGMACGVRFEVMFGWAALHAYKNPDLSNEYRGAANVSASLVDTIAAPFVTLRIVSLD